MRVYIFTSVAVPIDAAGGAGHAAPLRGVVVAALVVLFCFVLRVFTCVHIHIRAVSLPGWGR